MKKTFAFLLSLTMILSLFGLTTFAETDEQNSEHTGHIPIIGKNLHCTDDLYCLICGYHMVRDEYLIGFGNNSSIQWTTISPAQSSEDIAKIAVCRFGDIAQEIPPAQNLRPASIAEKRWIRPKREWGLHFIIRLR